MKRMILIASFALLLCFGIFLLSSCYKQENMNEEVVFWIPEESRFIDYQLKENKIIFSYSICFVNNWSEDTTVSLSAKFKDDEISSWFSADEFVLGTDENGLLKREKIKKGEKKNIIFYFEGTYLGGDVNNNLSFPEEILLIS